MGWKKSHISLLCFSCLCSIYKKTTNYSKHEFILLTYKNRLMSIVAFISEQKNGYYEIIKKEMCRNGDFNSYESYKSEMSRLLLF